MKTSTGLKTNRFWIIVICGILVVSAVLALFLGQASATHVLIYKDNELLTSKVNLAAVAKPYTIVVDGAADSRGVESFNVIEVEHGRIRISEADCPDGICVRQGWVSGGLIPIVCLPNRLVITFAGSNADIDAVVG